MIKSFKDKELEKCWQQGRCEKINPDLKRRVLIKLEWMDAAKSLNDLRSPPSNRLHPLTGDYEGYWTISVSGAWRLVFRFQEGHCYEVSLVQYH